MSDLMTRITLPGCKGVGWLDWGRLSADDAIKLLRSHAREMKRQAKAIEDARDWDFQIDLVVGSVKQRHKETIQLSSRL